MNRSLWHRWDSVQADKHQTNKQVTHKSAGDSDDTDGGLGRLTDVKQVVQQCLTAVLSKQVKFLQCHDDCFTVMVPWSTHTHRRMYACTHTCMDIHTHAWTYTHTYMHTHTHTCRCIHAHAHIHNVYHRHTYTHTFTHFQLLQWFQYEQNTKQRVLVLISNNQQIL